MVEPMTVFPQILVARYDCFDEHGMFTLDACAPTIIHRHVLAREG
jgi:hypothetical protein